MSDTSQGFLSRWQARREAVAAEQAAEDVELTSAAEPSSPDSADTVAAEASAETAIDAQQPAVDGAEEAELAAEPLPDPENIEVGGSFARFMSNDVDPLTRTAALRALWKQPQYNHIDGLIEYALDYSNQPKLSVDASMELAKKVFRHVVESATEEVEAEASALAATTEDNLPEVADEVSQNGQAQGDEPQGPVV
ncbi:DUF3306 domain-containing protein [Shewanella sp. 3B26]|jgi:hypothetical protein|uniref:DUF3306 domain-containing protein n=1 Tax=Shewanella zhuhaiensis TaxID=2919576 RepID=A0AAJ1BHU0_9GAMM|nr:DUF3306 domain-containing protein [Shewanella zhuhaiensis]MCH4295021.1 DUF3306 domain-containing protein [Shewanella zhuhaiensis]